MLPGTMVMSLFVDIHAKSWSGIAWETGFRTLEVAPSFCPVRWKPSVAVSMPRDP
jgi:hypothetical protein